MPRIYRVMTVEPVGGQLKPKLGSSARPLGVRIPPSTPYDIPVDRDGTVRPGTGGMSVAPTWRTLPRHRIPSRLQHLLPSALGRNDDACWAMGEGVFEPADLGGCVCLRIDSQTHGLVEPNDVVDLSAFESDLAATRGDWVIDER